MRSPALKGRLQRELKGKSGFAIVILDHQVQGCRGVGSALAMGQVSTCLAASDFRNRVEKAWASLNPKPHVLDSGRKPLRERISSSECGGSGNANSHERPENHAGLGCWV